MTAEASKLSGSEQRWAGSPDGAVFRLFRQLSGHPARAHQPAKPITPTPPSLTDIAAKETEETEGQGVFLPFLKDSSPFYHPTLGTV